MIFWVNKSQVGKLFNTLWLKEYAEWPRGCATCVYTIMQLNKVCDYFNWHSRQSKIFYLFLGGGMIYLLVEEVNAD